MCEEGGGEEGGDDGLQIRRREKKVNLASRKENVTGHRGGLRGKSLSKDAIDGATEKNKIRRTKKKERGTQEMGRQVDKRLF